MEHLSILTPLVSDYDMVMFCDDDDTYLPMRVEKFIEAFENTKEHCDKTGLQFGGVKEVQDANKVDAPPEYWAYGIPPSLLIEFFHRVKGYEDLMCHKFADMYLRNYLRLIGIGSIIFGTFVPDIAGVTMYQYTLDNPNSICTRQKINGKNTSNANTILRDTITLGLVCDRDDIVKKQMMLASVPLSRLNEVVPDADRIKHLINILYK